jgi:Tol biopolymer transport system component
MHITSGNDTLVAANATVNPVPAWSPDSQRLAYSAGSHVLVVHIQNSKISRPLKLQGSATVLCWSATTPDQLVLVLNNGQQGIYLVDTQDETSQQLAKDDIQSRIQWTQIP